LLPIRHGELHNLGEGLSRNAIPCLKCQTVKNGVRRGQVLGGIAAIAAGVLIGAYADLPSVAALPVAGLGTMVGGRLLAKAAEAACEHGPEFEQKNDLYFLLKLTEEV
jgi:hypothetical protein